MLLNVICDGIIKRIKNAKVGHLSVAGTECPESRLLLTGSRCGLGDKKRGKKQLHISLFLCLTCEIDMLVGELN